MKGFFNRVLVVDLSTQNHTVEVIDDEVYSRFLGGKGLGSYLLMKHNPPGVDPLAPENHLIFAVGQGADLRMHGSARYALLTKSPLTGLYSDSYSGGTPADHISRTGFDAVVIKGAAKEPVSLEISDQGVAFHSAKKLWGKDAFETETSLLEDSSASKAAAVCIGPAGENRVRFAAVSNNFWRRAGRTGGGAVMGSKQLKGIVFHGNARRQPADPDLLKEHWRQLAKRAKDDAGVAAYKRYGTSLMVRIMNEANAFPTRYWSQGKKPRFEAICGDALLERCKVKPKACPRCFMACGNMSEVKHGRHAGLRLEGPEYETIYAFGGLCLVESIEEIMFLNDRCDRLGMDTITSGNLVAFAMLASEKGVISEKIPFGDVDLIAETLSDISQRKGIGAVLAEGIVHAAKVWGMSDDAVHVKGLEPAGYDPRVLKGMGLSYAVNPRGACHLRATFYKPELAGIIDRDQIDGKAELFIDYEDRLTLFDTFVLCRFFRDLLQWEELATLVRGSTGLDLDKAGLKRIAGNITDIVRRFNIQEGVTASDDTLPARLFSKKVPPSQATITADELKQMVQDYYRLRGWDNQGVPLEGK